MNMGKSYTTGALIAEGKLSIGDGYRAKNAELAQDGLPFARAGNIDGGFHFDDADRFPVEDLDKVGEKASRPGDVVFTSKGTVGRFAFVTADVPRFVFSPQLSYWRSLDDGLIEPRFLFYWIQGSEFWLQAAGVKSQTDMADYVSLTDQRRMTITLPDIHEQRAIARVLGALDDKIELNREMNRTLEATAQAIFRSWFVDFDPVVAKADGRKPFGMSEDVAALFPDRFVESELGPIPEGWRVGSIAKIAEYVNGRNFTKNATGSGRMVIRIAELNSGPSRSTVYNEVETDDRHTAYPDDILFAWSGSLDVYRWHRDEAVVNQHIFKVICERFPKWFVYFQLKEAMPFFQRIAADKATTMGHIRRGHLDEAQLAVPPESALESASRAIEPLYELIHRNERESQTLADLRDILLPKLLSGEIRVGEAEKTVEEAA